MQFDLKRIFQPHLNSPLEKSDFQKGIILLSPLLVISIFEVLALALLFPLLALLSSRRLADLLGEDFYSSTRGVAAWILLLGIFSIPFIGIPLVLWVLCTWDRMRVREFLRDFFEVAELI